MKSILTFVVLSFSLLLLQGCEDPDISAYKKAVNKYHSCIAVNKGDCKDKKIKEDAFSKFNIRNNEKLYADYNILSESRPVREKIINKINLLYFKDLVSSNDEHDKLALVFHTIFEEQNLSAIINKIKTDINNGSEDDMSKSVMAAIPKLINNTDSISLEKRTLLGSLFYKNIMFEEALYVLVANNYPPLDKDTKSALVNIINNTCSAEDAANWYYYLNTITTDVDEKRSLELANNNSGIEIKYLNQAKKETSEAIAERRLPHFYSEKCVALMTKKQLSYPYKK